MYSEQTIKNKCLRLNPRLGSGSVTITVREDPLKVGHHISVSRHKDGPADKEVFLDNIVAEACLKQDDCQGWKDLLEELLK